MKELVVDTELRQDMQRPPVAVAPDDLRGLVAAGNCSRCMAQVVALEPAERRRVATLDVGVVIEATARAELDAEAHRLEGCQIERLFVDMENVRANILDQPSQPRVEMQVKMTVEPNRQHLQPVAPIMAPLELGRAYAGLLPTWRHGDCKLDAWQRSQLFGFALVGTNNH